MSVVVPILAGPDTGVRIPTHATAASIGSALLAVVVDRRHARTRAQVLGLLDQIEQTLIGADTQHAESPFNSMIEE